MAKDAYWFKHDSTAGRGLRMRKMAHIYGHWGKGIYWDVIEILRDQSNYTFDSDESSLQMLADLIGCKDEPKFLTWFRDCIRFQLFEIKEDKFFSEVLCENMAVWEVKKSNGGSKKRNQSKPESKIEAKQEHKIIQDNIIQDNIIKNSIGDTLRTPTDSLVLTLEQFNKEIKNSYTQLEAAARRNKTTPDRIISLIPDFIDTCRLKDKTSDTFKEYCNYFSNWLLTEFKNNKDKMPISVKTPERPAPRFTEEQLNEMARKHDEKIIKRASEIGPATEDNKIKGLGDRMKMGK